MAAIVTPGALIQDALAAVQFEQMDSFVACQGVSDRLCK